jgi:hypothetical protein
MRIVPILLGTISIAVTLMAADWAGTWKLNVEKSKVQGSRFAAFASATMTISETGPNSYTTTIDTVSKSGEQRHQEYLRINDGKEHPAKGVGLKRTVQRRFRNKSTPRHTRSRPSETEKYWTSLPRWFHRMAK